jgi:hypothetical protein
MSKRSAMNLAALELDTLCFTPPRSSGLFTTYLWHRQFLLAFYHLCCNEINVCIKMYLKQLGYEGVGWIHLAQDRDQWLALVNTVMNL